MRTAIAVALLLVVLGLTAEAKVSIPKLVPYRNGGISVLVPKGWQVDSDGVSITSVPPDAVIEKKGLVMLGITVESFSETLEAEVEIHVYKAKWSTMKGGWKCAAGQDPLTETVPAVICAKPMGDHHYLSVHVFGNASKSAMLSMVKKVAKSAKGFTIPVEQPAPEAAPEQP